MKRPLALAAALALLALLGWWLLPRATHPAEEAAAAVTSKPRTQNPEPKTARASAPRSTLADNLNSAAGDIRADLRIVSDILDTFRTNFPHDGNPVGSNAEITAALTGKNKLSLALIPPGHRAINAGGELCDRWGTPFFFHAESGTKMAIRSAGPDRKMWTDDDEEYQR